MQTPGQFQREARVYVAAVTVVGLGVFAYTLARWESTELVKGYYFLLLALITAALRVSVSRLAGRLPMDSLFVLLGVMELGVGETMLIGCSSTAVQTLAGRSNQRPRGPALFHIASTALAVLVTHGIYNATWLQGRLHWSAAFVLAGAALLLMTTLTSAGLTALAERRKFEVAWREAVLASFPQHLTGAVPALLFGISEQWMGPRSTLLVMPVALVIYGLLQLYLSRLTHEKKRAEALAALQQRTIEALAMAIEAEDLTSHTHLRRLQLYCLEIAKELKLPEIEVEALRAGAILHDIGKLAVPDHILWKAGRLSHDEFEKVKIHSTVGAEILERVGFPYPVAGVVRSHHEKWNGRGYPAGLAGEAIPMGARILAVADTLDALVSGRPYRSAIPIQEAIGRISAQSGISFDPQVVQVLQRRYQDLEAQLAEQFAAPENSQHGRERADIGETGTPGDGGATPGPEKPAYLDTIAAARQEAQVVLELEQQLGKSLELDVTLSALASGLERAIGFDTLVVHLVRDAMLVPRYARGEGASVFLTRQVQLGSGLCGWVAHNKKPILNGNPCTELGVDDESSSRLGLLSTAMVVPLVADGATMGTLMICRRGYANFNRDNLRILQSVSAKLGLVIQNAQKYEQASASATTDFLTGLPNARALFLHLESELARCRRFGGALTVLVTDLDGFKQVNDRYGHLEGNAVLRAVGAAMRQSCREYDHVARLGGDEFVLLLPGLVPADAEAKVQQLNKIVGDAGRSVCPESSLALSIGEAWFPTDGDQAEQLLAVADQRMYRAKEARKRRSREATRGYDFDSVEYRLP
jgi:diguanylate cyclase (GGDEF)-like protein/putative nucleotidyltransferase with HDIG domain